MKAIHNGNKKDPENFFVVIRISKIHDLKAIHNRYLADVVSRNVVIRISKIHDLKAIHNKTHRWFGTLGVVIRISKIHDLKAIHNWTLMVMLMFNVVIRISKIHDLKAIHNKSCIHFVEILLLSEYQRYMIWKQFTTKTDEAEIYHCCYQNIKDTWFESNSQLLCVSRCLSILYAP